MGGGKGGGEGGGTDGDRLSKCAADAIVSIATIITFGDLLTLLLR